MSVDISKVTDRELLTKFYHLTAVLAVRCGLERDVESMNMFEELTCTARKRVSELYGVFDVGHLHFYRSFRNQIGDLRNHVHDLSKFKFKDNRIAADALAHGIQIPDHMLQWPRSDYGVQPAPQPLSSRKVLDILEKFASAPTTAPAMQRIEVAAATREFKPSLSRANRQARLENKRGSKRRGAVNRNRGMSS